MSRIGKQPIALPPKVKVDLKGRTVLVEGPKGKLTLELPARTALKVEGNEVVLSRNGDDAEARALHGLSRALVNNMVKGVSEGFVKKLEIHGVGFGRGRGRHCHHESGLRPSRGMQCRSRSRSVGTTPS